MDIGVCIFASEYAIRIDELARAAEERAQYGERSVPGIRLALSPVRSSGCSRLQRSARTPASAWVSSQRPPGYSRDGVLAA